MPSRDANGKRIPGHAQRLRKAEREAPDPPTRKPTKPAAKKSVKPTPSEPTQEPASAEPYQNPFVRLAKPDDLDPSTLVSWSARYHVTACYEIATHPEWWTNKREWIRALTDNTSKFGAIKDRAAEQVKMAEVLRRDDLDAKKQGLVSAHGRTAPKVPRPPN